MSKVVEACLPCPHDGCNSSDGYHVYDDGHTFCFSCRTPTFPDAPALHRWQSQDTTVQFLDWRGIPKEVMEFYRFRTKVNAEGEPISLAIPYGREAILVRNFHFEDRKRKWYSVGKMNEAPLGGMELFSKGCAETITIFEGGLKAAAHRTIMGSQYPAVYLRSSSTARNDCQKARDFLNSFKKIYLVMDKDKAGEGAVQQIAHLFDMNKVYVTDLHPYNDVNDFLENGKERDYRRVWLAAKRYVPAGIVSTFSEVHNILNKSNDKVTYSLPFPSWEEKTDGIQEGEILLVTAMEGVGKTEVTRRMEKHFLETTDANIAVIRLEEGMDRSIKGIAGLELETPVHKKGTKVTNDAILEAYVKAVKRDERHFLYSHFDTDDPEIVLDMIRYMVVVRECKIVILDHLTAAVSGFTGDTVKMLDVMSTKLELMTLELGFALILVSHVNDDNKTKGSRNISKVSRIWVSLARDVVNPDPWKRSLTHCTFHKNTRNGETGPAGVLRLDPDVFKIYEVSGEELTEDPLPII